MLGHAYVAAHGGAGVHDLKYDAMVKQALRLACKEAIKCLQGSSPISRAQADTCRDSENKHLDMVEQAISILEDDLHLNAGYGSNLTLNGTVECDAAIMDGRSGDFGSVGATSGIKNPIRLARSVLHYSRKPDPLCRIPPLTLTGEGAHSFAITQSSNQIQSVPSESLVSPRAREEWKKWKYRLESSVHHGTTPDSMQDTVGAVAYHHAGGTAAGVSRYIAIVIGWALRDLPKSDSGGILLKFPGRIGEAGVFGAGCWSQQFAKPATEMACSVSGGGEHIVRTMLAHAVGVAINTRISEGADVDPHDILRCVLVEKFWEPCRKRDVLKPEAGILLLIVEDDGDKVVVRLWCAFTTPSMAIAYASSTNPKPKVTFFSSKSERLIAKLEQALILRQPNSREGQGKQEPPVYITAITL